MINSMDLRKKDFAVTENGYSQREVDAIIGEAADTIEAYQKESDELYHKLEVLATKIEEYRKEEDAIKTALITAEKVAEKITKESNENAQKLISESKAKAEETVSNANKEADSLVSNSRDYAKNLITEKTAEADKIISEAQAKANEAIESAKVVADDLIAQAKQKADDLVSSSKSEKEAYEILTTALKTDAKEFIENVKAMYEEQLSALNGANLESKKEEPKEEVKEYPQAVEEILPVEPPKPKFADFDVIEDEAEEEVVEESAEPVADEVQEVEPAQEVEETPNIPSSQETIKESAVIEFDDEEEEETDPMEAIAAFSRSEVSPIEKSTSTIPEIDEEPVMESQKSLFEEEEELPFETYFNIKNEDVHSDKSQTISLIPPENDDDDDDDEPRFKGFFKKKK